MFGPTRAAVTSDVSIDDPFDATLRNRSREIHSHQRRRSFPAARHHATVTRVNTNTDLRRKLLTNSFNIVRRLGRHRSEDNTRHSRIAKLLHVIKRSNATTEFDRHIYRINDLSHHRAIRRLGFIECTIEIHHVNHLRARGCKLSRHLNRILIVNSHLRLSPLQQPHA